MGKVISQAPMPRKAPPAPIKRGRPLSPGNSSESAKFIMTLDPETYSEIATAALEKRMGIQQYIRAFVIPVWRESQ
jgi:hypothetical protein